MKVLNLKKIDKGCLLASFDLQFAEGGMILHDCKLFKKDLRYWVNLPQIEFEKDGKKCYKKIISFPEKLFFKILGEAKDVALAAYESPLEEDHQAPSAFQEQEEEDIPF